MKFPEGFLESISDCPGFDRESFIAAHEQPAEVSVRVNPFKPTSQFDSFEKVPWCESAFYLKERPEFIFDPLLHAGCYYVQEASSMFLSHAIKSVLDLQRQNVVLDLCAAPGGKSTLISSLIGNSGLLVSNEVIRARAAILLENIVKWNSFNTVVTNNDPQHFGALGETFDVIVVDAPCSGSGLFRKDPSAVNEWSENNVEHCFARQKRILADVLPSLKSGGYLFYSTCSYSLEEDEVIADWLMDDFELENVQIPVKDEWGIVRSESEKNKAEGYRFYPGKVRGEGFFLSVFKKKGDLSEENWKNEKALVPAVKNEIKAAEEVLVMNEKASLVKNNDELVLISKAFSGLIAQLKKKLNVLSFRTVAGKMIRADFLPAHELAMTSFLKSDLPFVEVDLEQAIRFLRKEDVRFNTTAKGWLLIKYNGFVLGWIKSLGNRSNNYYPKEWRILKRWE